MTEDAIIYRHKGKDVGRLTWGVRPGNTYEMHLDVDEGLQRSGIGTALLQHLERMVKEHKGMCIYSFCAGDNEKAIGFFTKTGFTKMLITGFYGKGRDAYFLYKTVGAPE